MTEPTWTLICSYDYTYEADAAEATLQSADIPVLVKGREAGIWGPGFAGPTSQGLSVWVPADAVDEAHEVLGTGAEPLA